MFKKATTRIEKLRFGKPVVHIDEPRYIGYVRAFHDGTALVEWNFGPAFSSWHTADQLTHDLESCRDFLNRADAEHPDGFWGPETGGNTWRLRCHMIRIDLGPTGGERRIQELCNAIPR